MAFGKKKNDESPLIEQEGEEQGAPVNLFEEDAADEDEAAPDPSEASSDVEPAPVEAVASPAPDALAGDALLSLFGESESVGDDRAAALDLAGDVEMSDLIEDLRTVAVALRIDTSRMG